MKTIYRYLIVLFVSFIPASVVAQSQIDKLIRELEKKSDVEITYTERRTPKKHKLYRVTQILNFANEKYYQSFAKAFEAERQYTESAVKNGYNYVYRFVDDKGESTYNLTRNGAVYRLVKSWSSKTVGSDSAANIGDDDFDIYNGTITLVNGSLHRAEQQNLQARRELCRARHTLQKARNEVRNVRRKMSQKNRPDLNQYAGVDEEIIIMADSILTAINI